MDPASAIPLAQLSRFIQGLAPSLRMSRVAAVDTDGAISVVAVPAEVEIQGRRRGAAQIHAAAQLVGGNVRREFADAQTGVDAGADAVVAGIVNYLDVAAGRSAVGVDLGPRRLPVVAAVVARIVTGGEVVAHGREHAAPVLLDLIAEGDAGLDVADLVFQIPVPAEERAAGEVGAGGDVGPGERGQIADHRLTLGAAGEVAPI